MTAQIVSTTTMRSIAATSCAATEQDAADRFGPAGHHLRWFYPAADGYPAGGADIWHLGERDWAALSRKEMVRADLVDPVSWTASTNWSGRDRHHPVHRDAVIITRSDAIWKPTRDGLHAADRGDGATFVIHFNQPVVAVRLTVRRAAEHRRTTTRSDTGGLDLSRNTRSRTTHSPTTDRLDVVRRDARGRANAAPDSVSVRHGAHELDVVPFDDEIVIEGAGITDLVIPNAVDTIADFRFLTEVAAAEVIERNGRRLTHLDLPTDVSDAYELVDVELGQRNRMFAGSTVSALKRSYPAKAVAQLVGHLGDTIGAPNHTVSTPSAPDQPSSDVRVLDHLRLASVDPIVARMLASYWVDPKPQPGVYLIRADYESPDKVLGFGFVFTDRASDPPKLEQAVAQQLPGIEYQQRTPLGRVGVTFDGVETSTEVARTVMVDIDRYVGDKPTPLTKERPHLANRAARRGYTDRGLRIPGTYRYQITPFDIFGRQGTAADSQPVELVDLSRPTPPKHLVAAVAQHGAPWLDASERSDQDRTGTLDATAEFAEAQLTVAPDAAEIMWCWRSDPGDRDPSSWHALSSSKVVVTDTVEVAWQVGERVTEYPLTVASARVLDDATIDDRLDRLDAVTRSAVDDIGSVQPLVEVLLQTALLEPDLFAGHTVEVDGAMVEVIGSTAGVAAADDTTGDAKMTARLFVQRTAETLALVANDVLRVRHPVGADWSIDHGTPPPLVHVPLPPNAAAPGQAEGGEVAVDLSFVHVGGGGTKLIDHDEAAAGRVDTTIVGRVVSDHRVGRDRSVLLRVRPDDATRLSQIELSGDRRRLRARHHRPYLMDRQTIGLDGAAGTLQIDFAPEQRFTSIWLSAFTTDDGGLRSTQVAMPVEVRVVRPPPAARPQPPFPEAAGVNATNGELTPPDVDGTATARLAWPPIDAGTVSDHVHYEVARALASSIVATDRDRWFRGAPPATDLGVTAGRSVTTATNAPVVVPAAGESNGTVRLLVDAITAADFDARDYAGGRVILGDGGDGDGEGDGDGGVPDQRSVHRLLRVAPGSGGGLELLIRPVVLNGDLVATAQGTTCVLEAAPSYDAVLADDGLVRQLADLPGTNGRSDDTNEQAFGLVTGTPIAALRFVDRLPGIGRSRFFYKVRAVYPGETRSRWSPTSVAFHQVDTTAADPIIDSRTSRVRAADEATADEATDETTAASTIVSFRLPDDPLVVGVRRRTLAADGTVLTERDEHADAASGQHQLGAARITSAGGIIDLSRLLGPAVLRRHATATDGDDPVIRLFPDRIDRSAPSDEADLLPSGDVSRPLVIGREHDGTKLAIAVRQPDGSTEWIDSVTGRHEVAIAHTHDATTLSIAALKFVTVDGIAHPFHSAPTVIQIPASPPSAHDAVDTSDGE